jgi:hypothetical protein
MQGVLFADLASHRVYAGEALEEGLPIRFRELRGRGRAGENLAAESQGLLPVTVGQQAVALAQRGRVAGQAESQRISVPSSPAKVSIRRTAPCRCRGPGRGAQRRAGSARRHDLTLGELGEAHHDIGDPDVAPRPRKKVR